MRRISTYWYLECPEHEPPLRSEGEFTQHTDDYAYREGIELATARPLDADYSADDGYFQRNARRFLIDHPRCHLNVVSETGERRPLEIEGATLIEQRTHLLRSEITALNAQIADRLEELEQLQRRANRLR